MPREWVCLVAYSRRYFPHLPTIIPLQGSREDENLLGENLLGEIRRSIREGWLAQPARNRDASFDFVGILALLLTDESMSILTCETLPPPPSPNNGVTNLPMFEDALRDSLSGQSRKKWRSCRRTRRATRGSVCNADWMVVRRPTVRWKSVLVLLESKLPPAVRRRTKPENRFGSSSLIRWFVLRSDLHPSSRG